jgi:hypothetical protein
VIRPEVEFPRSSHCGLSQFPGGIRFSNIARAASAANLEQ